MGKEKTKTESTLKELRQDNKELRKKVNSMRNGENVDKEQENNVELIEELKNKLDDKETTILALELKIQKLEGEIRRQKQEVDIMLSQNDSNAMLSQIEELHKESLERKEAQSQKTKLDNKTKELIRKNEALKGEVKQLKELLAKSEAKVKELEQKGESPITDKQFKETLAKINVEKKKLKDDVINKDKSLRQTNNEIDTLKVMFISKL